MNRRTWLLIVLVALAAIGMSSVASAGLLTNSTAAAPSSNVAAQAPAKQNDPLATQPTKEDPFGIRNFNCADMGTYKIEQQMNIRAAAIVAKCGGKSEVTSSASKDTVSTNGSSIVPDLGGTDADVVLPDGAYPHVTQSESFVWGHGSTVVVNYNDSRTGGTCYAGISYSTDGGATWHVTSGLCTGHGTNYGDPTVVYNASYNKWYATDLASGCGGQGLGAWTSTDGITWTAGPCVHTNSQDDRNSFWVDNNASSPYYGYMYESYNDFNIGGGALLVTRSIDGGVTWQTPVQVANGTPFIRDVQITGDLQGSGKVYLAGMNEGGGGLATRINIMYNSTNGGTSFTGVTMGAAFYPPGRAVSGYFAGMYSGGYFRHMGWGQPAASGNVVSYVYAMGISGTDPGNVMYTRSTDSGATWSAPIQLNTDATTKAQFMPSLTATQGGALLAAWYDERNSVTCTPGGTTSCLEWYGRVSLDNGATWQTDAAISDSISPLAGQPDSAIQTLYAGDYNYASSDGTTAYTTWMDGRTIISGASQQDVDFDKVPLIQGTPTPTVTGTLPTASPTNTSTLTPTATATVCGGTAPYATSTIAAPTIVAGTTDVGNHTDDGTTQITLPFSFRLYDQTFTTANVSSNGQLDFLTADSAYTNSCLPDTTASYAIFPYWDDQRTDNFTGTGEGIFTSISGSAPNRIFNIEWRTEMYSGGAATNYEVRLYEGTGQSQFDVIYGTVTAGNTSATSGVQRDTGSVFQEYFCNGSGGTPTGGLHYQQPTCGSPVPTSTAGTPSATATSGSGSPTATATCVAAVGSWAAGPDLPSVLARSVGVYFPADGNFYLMGGRSSDVAGSDQLNPLEFNTSTSTWSTKSATYNDNQVNNQACGVLTQAGTPYIFCVGGSAAGNTTASAQVRQYNPATDTLTALATDNWPGNSAGTVLPGGFAVANNKLYILGGFNINTAATNEIWEFDPNAAAGSRWVQKVNAPSILMYAPAATIGGTIYVGGASDYQAGAVVDTNLSFSFNPTTNTIGTITTIPRATGETRAVVVNGQMWVLGGGRVTPNPSNEVDVYDPTTNAWTLGPAFTNNRRNPGADSDPATGRVWMAGGYDATGTTLIASLEIYTPGASCGTPVPTATAGTPTDTATSVPTNTATSVSTSTATSVSTDTPVPTDTTVVGTATETATGTPPTATNTVTETQTATETVTGTPPTATSTPTACTLAFEDVPVGSTFYQFIECLACRGIINGYPCGGPLEPCNGTNDPYFRPSNNVTRGQFAKMASNSAGFNDPPGGLQYTDVPIGSTYYDFIWRLTDRGLVSGYPCGGTGEPCDGASRPYFRPNSNVTRGQLAKIDANAANFTEAAGAQQYEDVLPGSTFYDYIWRLSNRGIINGYPCGGATEPCGTGNLPYFRPSANATRGQASKIVSNTFFPNCTFLQRPASPSASNQ